MHLRLKGLGCSILATRTALQRAAALLLAFILLACSAQSLPLSLTYTPDHVLQAVSGAESVYVEVAVNDSRPDKITLGKLSAGIVSIALITHDDVAQVVKSGVESEMINRGFEVGPGNALVIIDLDQIEVLTTQPFMSSQPTNVARAAAIMSVQVKGKTGATLFSTQMSGAASLTTHDETASAVSQRALDYAIDNAIRNLVTDPAFVKALLATRQP